ncbi:hypothetical protein CZ797_06865 [Pseudoalteromonas sp. JB197]|nr:hypothetical protein CZ797_06865 [Pseudoalteromonas sp. JB197]
MAATKLTTMQKMIASSELKNKHSNNIKTQKKTTIGLWSVLFAVTVNLYTNSV